MDCQVSELTDIPETDNDLIITELSSDDHKEETSVPSIVDFPEAFDPPIHAHEDCEDCCLDDMFLRSDGHECSISSIEFADDLINWVETELPESESGVDDDQWRIEGIGWSSSLCYGDAAGVYDEQEFCPLWE